MESSEAQTSNEDSLARAVETTVRIAIVLLLVALCLQILAPFAAPVAWGIIIAVALTPVHKRIVTVPGRCGFETSAHSEPSRHDLARLGPTEDPGDGS